MRKGEGGDLKTRGVQEATEERKGPVHHQKGSGTANQTLLGGEEIGRRRGET